MPACCAARLVSALARMLLFLPAKLLASYKACLRKNNNGEFVVDSVPHQTHDCDAWRIVFWDRFNRRFNQTVSFPVVLLPCCR